MSLRDWLNNGWLSEHQATAEEIQDLLDVADRDLADSRTSGLSADWRLAIAYNAALQAAAAALAAEGYRAAREAHHFRVIQSLAFTVQLDPARILQFDRFRKKRNVGGYERAGAVSEHEAEEMRNLAVQLRQRVEQWLREKHPELMLAHPPGEL